MTLSLPMRCSAASFSAAFLFRCLAGRAAVFSSALQGRRRFRAPSLAPAKSVPGDGAGPTASITAEARRGVKVEGSDGPAAAAREPGTGRRDDTRTSGRPGPGPALMLTSRLPLVRVSTNTRRAV